MIQKYDQGDAFMALLRRLSFITLFTTLFTTLVGCNGGSLGTGSSTDDNSTDTITISLSISNTLVTEQSPVIVTATLKQGNSVLGGKLIRFSVDDPDLAFFGPENGAVSTNSEGIAEIEVHAGMAAGGGIITAKLDSQDVSAEIVFESQGDGNTGNIPVVASVNLYASSQQIASSGTESVTLTALVKDSANNLIEGATIDFSADSGQLKIGSVTTGTDGKATAILTTDSEPSNRIININAKNESIFDSVSVQVIGTVVNVSGSSSLAINDENQIIVNVLDSDGTGVANTDVTLSLSNVSTVTPSGDVAQITLPTTIKTDFTGQATVVVVGTTGGTNSIMFEALGASVSHDVSVQADSFLFTSFNNNNGTVVNPTSTQSLPDVLLSDNASISITWLRDGFAIPDGTMVSFTSTRGVLASSSGTTVNGSVTATIASSNSGKALVTFTGTDDGVTLNNQLEFEFVAETVDNLIMQASPHSIGPNGETSIVSMVARDIEGNLVKNKIVDFTLTDISGGAIFPASAITDSNGSASTVYTSNTVTAQDGVEVLATIREDSSKNESVTLTVADKELFIVLGTGNEMVEVDTTTYNKEYTVFVTDVNSNPQENVTVQISAVPSDYYKGRWVQQLGAEGSFEVWVANHTAQCANEDLNIDGILDVGEDTNGDNMLTPGNVVAAAGEVKTDQQGRAVIDILYPQSFAHWVDINLVATAKVDGSESVDSVTFTLPVLVSDVDQEFSPPPSAPFGASSNCNDIN